MGQNAMEYDGDFLADDDNEEELRILDMMKSDQVMRFARGGSLEVVSDFHGLGDTAAYEKFMTDPIVIKIHTTTDKNASPVIPVGINGDQKWLPRGVPIRVPRSFVERLAQSQTTAYKTVENPDKASDSGMLNKSTTAHEFPFDVIQDPSRYGGRWLKRMMKQG